MDKRNGIPSEFRPVSGPGMAMGKRCDCCQRITGKPKTVKKLKTGPLRGMRNGVVCPDCVEPNQ